MIDPDPYRTGITILQFIFFVPALFIAVYLCFHHGMKAAGTWRFIATLSCLRLAGDISYFISLSHPSLNVYVAVIVCELMGLAPLMLTSVALVGRVNLNTHTFPPKAAFLISLLSLTGLIIGIVGTDRALEDAPTTDDVKANGLMKGALACFLAGFGLMLIGFSSVVFDITRHPAKRVALGTEIRILIIVGLAAPFLFVRLLYGALGDFSGKQIYSSLYGNDTIYLCMGILMEIFTVSFCLCAAFFVPMPAAEHVEQRSGLREGSALIALSPAT